MQFIGTFMRAMEVFAVVFYCDIVFNGMRYYSQWTLKDHIDFKEILEFINFKDKSKHRLYTEVL